MTFIKKTHNGELPYKFGTFECAKMMAKYLKEQFAIHNVSVSLPTIKEIDDEAIAYAERVHPNDRMKTFRDYSRTDYVNGAIAIRNKWIKSNEP